MSVLLLILLSSCGAPAANAGGTAGTLSARVATAGPMPTTAAPPPRMPTVAPLALGTTLGGIALGMHGPEVLRVLGEPKVRTVAHGRGTPQWEYADGLTVQLNDPTSPVAPYAVWELLARPPFSGATAEGLRLGDSESQFRSLYRNLSVTMAPVPPTQLGVTDSSGTSLNVQFDAAGQAMMITLTKRDAICGGCGGTQPTPGGGKDPS